MSEARKTTPGSHRINECILITQEGEEVDIRLLIDHITVTESIYSLYAKYEIMIVDAVLLLEKYAIVGNEKIELEISKYDSKNEETVVRKYLILSGIKNYVRGNNQTQTYKLTAITEEAMLSSIKRISRSVRGTSIDIIRDIYGSDVQYKMPLNIIDSNVEGNYRGVIPNKTINNTFAYLVGISQNTSGSNFYMYETLWNNMQLSSYSEMINRQSLDEYALTMYGSSSEKDYDEVRKKIKDIDSNIGASNFDAFTRGAFKAKTHVIDIATKTYNAYDFDLSVEQLPRMDKAHRIDPNYTIAGRSISDIRDPKIYMVNKNSLAYGGTAFNFNEKNDISIAKKNAIVENQYSLSHRMKLAGDTRLYPGNTIDVKLPPAAHPGAIGEHQDEMMSGKYLIASVIHRFESNGAYTIDVSIKKDSVDRQKMIDKYRNMENVN